MLEQHLGSSTAGVWTAAAARAAGLSDGAIRWRLRTGVWQRLRRGTYADAGIDPSPLMRASAAVQATGPRAVAAGRTAARCWGLPLVDDDDPALGRYERWHDDVAVRAAGRGAGTLHRHRLALPVAETTVLDGVPLLTPLRTLLHLAVVLRPDALVAAVDGALHRSLMTVDALAAYVVDAAALPGAARLRRAVALADPLAESPHETLTRLVLKPVLPGLVSQVRVRDRHGNVIARLDLGDRTLRLGVESDGATFHTGRAAADRRRDARTGWAIERCTWYETRREPDRLRARVLATAARQRAEA